MNNQERKYFVIYYLLIISSVTNAGRDDEWTIGDVVIKNPSV